MLVDCRATPNLRWLHVLTTGSTSLSIAAGSKLAVF